MRRPDPSVLLAFACVVLIGGSNFVAVRFSNRELAPFWGAGLRFALAAALLLLFARWRGIPLPRRDALGGVIAFGIVNFGVFYALAYWGLLTAPAAVGATLVAVTPLLTYLLATALGMERFRWAGVAGAVISLAGVAVVFADQLRFDVPLSSLLALFLAALSIAVATILLKRVPRTHPIGTNAVAMIPGALLLLALSALARETPVLPRQPEVALAFLYLVTVGAIGLFAGVVYVVQRWTASASAYVTVLFPIVAAALGVVLADEPVSVLFLLGVLLVMVGTYIGAIAQPGAPAAERAAA
jgi:drug/metabolite transporter (DMT)-like permease